MTTALAMLLAIAIDACFGEPRRVHPLVAFGRLAGWTERRLYLDRRRAGVLAWSLAVVPFVAIAWFLVHALASVSSWTASAISSVTLYLTIGLRSLGEHASSVAGALDADDLDAARNAVAQLVSRDTALLDGERVAAAATESVLENGNDAVFGALFWFAVLGAPGAVLYRLANTLDAMWGYRTLRYERFGWAAARIDDVLNYVPARLTALTYALLGDRRRALRCWRLQASQWDSPNAGPVMAAGAGALGVRLGGSAPYHGVCKERPILGEGVGASASSITRALHLVRSGTALWLLLFALGAILVAIARCGGGHA